MVTLGVSWFLSLDDLVDADVLFRCVNVAGPGLKKKKKKKKKAKVMVLRWELQYERLLHLSPFSHYYLSSPLD